MVTNKPTLRADIASFRQFVLWYAKKRAYAWFARFEVVKDFIVDLLYKRRGKYAQPFLHTLTLVILFLGITLGPQVVKSQAEEDTSADVLPSGVLMNSSGQEITGLGLATVQSEDVLRYRGGEIFEHVVTEGETLQSIAKKYNLEKVDTITWLNELKEKDPIKPGQKLKILPVDGVLHKVKKGDTLCTIARTYGLIEKGEDCGSGAQPIVDYPFNTFTNDEFGLQVGQYIVVPEGVLPQPTIPLPSIARRLTPNAGAVSATGQFIWPAAGRITQEFKFYHPGIDIANRSGGPILAADSGRVIAAGWDATGYGNKVLIDHGNGFITLYGHLSVISVREGQTVHRGDLLGQMGSTGRSTGTHLHFEVRQGGGRLNPLTYLK